MSNFIHTFASYSWNEVSKAIHQKNADDVSRALQATAPSLDDFMALISPAGQPFLEKMAQKSKRHTQNRFGNTMQLYAPLYLSNECQNICTYCGFSFTNKIPRKTLTDEEILQEAKYLKSKGYNHVLLVTGEANRTVGVAYLKNAIKLLKPLFANISIEVQPLLQHEYEELIEEGLYAVLVYQETYHEQEYKKHHPKGKKSNFEYRITTPDRLGKAGIHKIGLGALYGLEDWRVESFYIALHLCYLQKQYWKTKFSISFPRLRPFSGGLEPKVNLTDKELAQLICAFRLFDEDVELSLSTRESEHFRDHVIHLGITSMSAESKTNPGGYTVDPQALEQFEISDERPTSQIQHMLQKSGFEVVWKDWHQFETL